VERALSEDAWTRQYREWARQYASDGFAVRTDRVPHLEYVLQLSCRQDGARDYDDAMRSSSKKKGTIVSEVAVMLSTAPNGLKFGDQKFQLDKNNRAPRY
jgi:hypothetical protein